MCQAMCDDCPIEQAKIQDGLTYEIHVTAFLEDNRNIERLRAGEGMGCYRTLQVQNYLVPNRPIWISDIFTASTVKGQDLDAFVEMNRVANFLRTIPGVRVVREKIEAVPWHPGVPNSESNFGLRDYQYFESHLQFPGYVPAQALREAGFLVSRNLRKPDHIMGTVRERSFSLASFKCLVAGRLAKLSVKPEKEIIEFTLYDSKREHDMDWEKYGSNY